MKAEPIRYFKPTDRAYFGHDLLLIPRDGSRWGLTFEVDFKGQRRRAAMRTAYRAKTKHRRRKP